MITVSLCMIVKNEEKILDRCLKSLVALMDEIIIVDTGSTDQTKEIAKKYTDQIYDFTWCDDYAAARNFSFEKATCDYIYCADADEVLDECNQQRFLLLKQAMLPEVEIVQMYYCNQMQFNTVYNYDREYRPKMYKRIRQFQWQDPVHEMVRLQPIVFDSDIEILHLPTGCHASRDFSSFENMILKGEHLSKRLHNMYAKELYIAGTREDFMNAVEFFKNSMEDNTKSMDEVTEACCVVARASRLENDDTTFLKCVLKVVATTGCAEICYEIGEYFKDKEDYKEASVWYYNAAFETESILCENYRKVYAKQALAECYRMLGYDEKAEELERMLQEADNEEC